jgi:hypothetical protein
VVRKGFFETLVISEGMKYINEMFYEIATLIVYGQRAKILSCLWR